MRRNIRALFAVAAATGLAALLSSGPAAAEILGPEELKSEMRINEALSRHVKIEGYPDLAQRWRVDPSWPWQAYIVRLFYLRPRTEIAFSRAYVLDRPDVGLLRYKRPMSEELAAELRRFLATAPAAYDYGIGADGSGPVERAEAAAKRAYIAAEMTALGAAAAEQAAERLEAAATDAERSFEKQLQK